MSDEDETYEERITEEGYAISYTITSYWADGTMDGREKNIFRRIYPNAGRKWRMIKQMVEYQDIFQMKYMNQYVKWKQLLKKNPQTVKKTLWMFSLNEIIANTSPEAQ